MRVFVTGASGHIGSAVVPELLQAGHRVVGLARSDSSAEALAAAGAEVRRGDLDDLDGLREAAGAADGVIHLAFRHDLMGAGDFAGAVAADLAAIKALASALEGTGKPLVTTSGTLMLAFAGITGRPGTEADFAYSGPRVEAENLVVGLADHGVRSSIGRGVGVPVASISAADAAERFAFLGPAVGVDNPASSEVTRKVLGWEPAYPGLIEDLEHGHYFQQG
jgi:nucleoside-diphosphate-sugar epimerase